MLGWLSRLKRPMGRLGAGTHPKSMTCPSFSVPMSSKIGPRTCVPSFLEAALGQVASEGWEPSLQVVLMGVGLTARKFLSFLFSSICVTKNKDKK